MSGNERFLCFKPTRRMHESGYRYIEFGYLTYDEDDKEAIEVVDSYDVVLGRYNRAVPYHLDLTKSGWFRVIPEITAEIEWTYGGQMVVVEPSAVRPYPANPKGTDLIL